jgi:hypothetical protein
MAASVNLMTQRAQYRSAADRIIHGWALINAVLLLAMLPLAAWTWIERRDMVRAHDALEAGYEPIRRLAGANRRLGAEAASLIDREEIALELSRSRPAAALIAAVADAVAEAQGAVFVEHFTLSHDAPLSDPASRVGRLTLEVSGMLGYDASRLAKQLDRPPFTSAKIISSETVNDGPVPHKAHVIQCEF